MRLRFLPALVACILVASAPAAAAQGTGGRGFGAVVSPIRLVPSSDEPVTVSGLHSYFGAIELSAASDGLVVVNELPLERYLLGLNEVPLHWPIETLRAQAIAARTYALYTLGQPPGGAAAAYGFDICASVACQVYSGADVLDSFLGARWVEAVRSTAGTAVLYRSEPILARYHSTSGGVTLNNGQAFPDEPEYPYLRSVPSTTEGGSPLYRWTVRFSLPKLQSILEEAGWWQRSTHGRLTRVRSIRSRTGFHYPDLLFRGRRGLLVRTAEEFRDLVRDLGPAMYPSLYPSSAETSSGRLPETLPSNRIDVTTRDRTVTILGRGWGHGVGMSQWGAQGMGQQGSGYADILTHYYSGVTLGEVGSTGPISVGVGWQRDEVVASGSFDIVDGDGKALIEGALGSWRFRWAEAGAIEIDPPRGWNLPLKVGIVEAPEEAEVGEPASLTIALSRPARVRTITTGSPSGFRDVGSTIAEAGRHEIPWLAPVEPGRYRVVVRARSGSDRHESRPIEMEVREAPPPPPSAQEAPSGGERPPSPALAAGLLLAVAAALALVVGTIRR